jgi:hypothetical protein
MPTKEVSAKELQTLDPKRFEREYWKWVEHHYWEGDCVVGYFIEKLAEEGIFSVGPNDVQWSGFYYQGSGASFSAQVDLLRYMRDKGYDESHQPLYLDMENYGVSCKISPSRSNCMPAYADIDYTPGNCQPDGIYADLPQEAWDRLLEAQWNEVCTTLEHDVAALASDKADELYKDLESDYDYCTSEEQFIESCECNEVTFEIEEEQSCAHSSR